MRINLKQVLSFHDISSRLGQSNCKIVLSVFLHYYLYGKAFIYLIFMFINSVIKHLQLQIYLDIFPLDKHVSITVMLSRCVYRHGGCPGLWTSLSLILCLLFLIAKFLFAVLPTILSWIDKDFYWKYSKHVPSGVLLSWQPVHVLRSISQGALTAHTLVFHQIIEYAFAMLFLTTSIGL